MNAIGGSIGGIVGGAIGAAVWAAIAYFTGYEIGWIAIGVGVVVGIGVAVGWRDGGTPAGALAAVITVAAIAGGKYAAVELSVKKALGEDSELEEMMRAEFRGDEAMVVWISDQLIGDRIDAGETIEWPNDVEIPMVEADYPADVWADATARWDGMSPDAQRDFRDETVAAQLANMQAASSFISQEAFKQSFGLMDVLFFGIGLVTAFKIGASGAIGDAEV